MKGYFHNATKEYFLFLIEKYKIYVIKLINLE